MLKVTWDDLKYKIGHSVSQRYDDDCHIIVPHTYNLVANS